MYQNAEMLSLHSIKLLINLPESNNPKADSKYKEQ